MSNFRGNQWGIVVGVLAGMLLLSLALLAGPASATPGSGVTPTPIVSGTLDETVWAKFKAADGGFTNGIKVKNLTMVKYTVAPGGTFGWHRHGGPVWAIVAEGTFTLYDGDDESCTGQVLEAGSAFLDEGNHTHVGRNETDQPVVVYTTFMLPEGGEVRIDAPDPGVCGF